MTRAGGTEIGTTRAVRIGIIAVIGLMACASASAEGLVDPTRPTGVARERDAVEAVPAGPVLQSTIISANIKRAIISGKSYQIGDRLGAAMIADIRPYEVVLDEGGREWRLRIVPALVREASRTGNDEKTR